MTTQYFTCESSSGGKFWKITQDGSSTTVVYGAIGKDGRTTEKEHGTEEKAEKFVASMIAKKVKGGYEASEEGGGGKRKAAPKKAAAKKKAKKVESEEEEEEAGDDDADESHYLEAASASGGKFWEAKRYGSSITVRFGKIGSAGQTRTKDHGTAAKAEKFLATTLKKKQKGGYE